MVTSAGHERRRAAPSRKRRGISLGRRRDIRRAVRGVVRAHHADADDRLGPLSRAGRDLGRAAPDRRDRLRRRAAARARAAQREARAARLRRRRHRRRAARPRDGVEPLVRSVHQSGVPAAPAHSAARVDPARDRLARPGRRGESADHLVRRVRAGGDQQLQRRARDRAVPDRSGAHARRAAPRCSCAKC